MLKKILIGLGALIAIVLIIAAFKPNEFQISRTATIAAPAPEVFSQVNDFHKMEAWSPWLEPDPTAKTTFDGAPAGEGAIYGWSGNNDVGEGRMTIVESRPNEFIRIKMDFIRPFANTAETVFLFRPEGDQTVVTQTMSGKNKFFGKVMCLFMNMDKMIGSQFDKGFAKMNTLVRAAPKQ